MSSSTSTGPPVPFPATWASVRLDLLRGLAAFFVLFEHWRNLFFIDYPHITAYRLPFAVFYALASAGHQSVILFFVFGLATLPSLLPSNPLAESPSPHIPEPRSNISSSAR